MTRRPSIGSTPPPLAERLAEGKARRRRAPREALASFAVRPRPDLVARLRQAVAGRRAALLPIRWGRMAASPFAFMRGAADLMAGDVGARRTAGLAVQACGDAHLLNLGAYAAPDGHLVFDLNDFDETCRGPFEWDLWRLAASIVVGARTAGLRDAAAQEAVRDMAQAYRRALAEFAELPVLELARHEVTPSLAGRRLAPIFQAAARNSPAQLLLRHTVPGRGGFARFRSAPPLLVPVAPAQARRVLGALRAYRDTLGPGRQQVLDRYRPHDVAFKVVGTGSVGVEVHVVLLYGTGPGDPLFLQVKEEDAPCWRPWLTGPARAATGAHQGRRTAEGQLRTQTVADPFLGWTRLGAHDCLVRQWSDHKASVDVGLLAERRALAELAPLCGAVLAKAHARTGDAGQLAGYCGQGATLDRALARFALAYADQTEADHAGLRRAIRTGLLEARLA